MHSLAIYRKSLLTSDLGCNKEEEEESKRDELYLYTWEAVHSER